MLHLLELDQHVTLVGILPNGLSQFRQDCKPSIDSVLKTTLSRQCRDQIQEGRQLVMNASGVQVYDLL